MKNPLVIIISMMLIFCLPSFYVLQITNTRRINELKNANVTLTKVVCLLDDKEPEIHKLCHKAGFVGK